MEALIKDGPQPESNIIPKSLTLTLRKDQNARQAQLAETKLRKLCRYVYLFTRS